MKENDDCRALKRIRPMVERMVTVAKKQQLASLRSLISKLPKKRPQTYYDISPRYQSRAGGYLRYQVGKGACEMPPDGDHRIHCNYDNE